MKRTAIIVDDVVFMNNTAKGILEQNNYSIKAQAYNGIEAIEQYRKHKPDLVVMDINMPEMDGFDALREIKKYDNEAKIVMCTSYWQPEVILQCIQAGACGYVIKPFYPDTFVALLNEAVNNRQCFDNQAFEELLDDQRLTLSQNNIPISQNLAQKIVNACHGGNRSFLELL